MKAYGILDLKDPLVKGMLNTIATCNNMNVPVPKAIREFFENVGVDNPEILTNKFKESGVISSKGEIRTNIKIKKYRSNGETGIEIDINRLPKGLKKVIIINERI